VIDKHGQRLAARGGAVNGNGSLQKTETATTLPAKATPGNGKAINLKKLGLPSPSGHS
jgi:hypothetical protein